MKRITFLTILILALAVQGKAQSAPVAQANGTPHSTTISWTPATQPTGVTVAGYNVYKSTAAGKEAGTVALNGAAVVAGTSFTDTTVIPGATAFYIVETQSTTANQSAPSNEVSATTQNNPNPPVITITSVSVTPENGQDRLQVNWSDTNGAATAFTIFGAQGQVLKQASQTTTNGIYSYAILIPVQSGVFSLCDASACISQSFAGI